jgi:hypothetical protein
MVSIWDSLGFWGARDRIGGGPGNQGDATPAAALTRR